MFYVLLTYLNIFNEGVFLPSVNSVALKWRRVDKQIPQSGVKRSRFRRCNHLFGVMVGRCDNWKTKIELSSLHATLRTDPFYNHTKFH